MGKVIGQSSAAVVPLPFVVLFIGSALAAVGTIGVLSVVFLIARVPEMFGFWLLFLVPALFALLAGVGLHQRWFWARMAAILSGGVLFLSVLFLRMMHYSLLEGMLQRKMLQGEEGPAPEQVWGTLGVDVLVGVILLCALIFAMTRPRVAALFTRPRKPAAPLPRRQRRARSRR